MDSTQLPQSEYVVTAKDPQLHNNLWRNVILASAFLMLLVSLSAGAFVLATKKAVKINPTSAPITQLSGDYAPPATVVHPPESETESWKIFNTEFFSLKYPADWTTQKDATVENGVKLLPPTTPGTTSGIVTAPSQFVLISFHTASESAVQYVDKIQLNCCIGPSAIPGAESRFKKQSLTINGIDSHAYNPVKDTSSGWNYVFSDTKHIIEIFTSAPTPTGNSIENRIVSTFTLNK